jgi:hypothetical protein
MEITSLSSGSLMMILIMPVGGKSPVGEWSSAKTSMIT